VDLQKRIRSMSAPMVSQLIRLRRGPSWRNAKMRVRDPPSHGSTPTPAWPVTAMWRSSGKIIKGGAVSRLRLTSVLCAVSFVFVVSHRSGMGQRDL
jgi:hypothetical protein